MPEISVNVCVAFEDASSEYRLRMPAEALQNEGFAVRIYGHGEIDQERADVVVLSRPTTEAWASEARHLVSQGVAVVVDVDDHFGAVRPTHSVYKRSEAMHRNLMDACEAATLVTTTTPKLAKVYGHGKAVVLPNLIPERYLSIEPVPREIDRVLVGWSGTVGTHPNDLQQTRGQIARALNDNVGEFVYIGPRYESQLVKDALEYRRTIMLGGWYSFDMYPQAIASLDIGIAPLETCAFNDAKSSLKMLEYAALGVAPVGSATADNIRLAKAGIGLLARTPQDWYKHVRQLLVSPTYREDVIGKSRAAASVMTYEAHASRWADAWTHAASRCVSMSAAQ